MRITEKNKKGEQAPKHLPPALRPLSFLVQPFQAARPREEDAFYRRRLTLSIGVSCLLNLMFLWLLLGTNFSEVAWFSQKPKPKPQRAVPELVMITPPPRPPKRTFLETDPSQASKEKPKNAEHYSTENTLATQTSPSPIKPGDAPKVDGKNTKSAATQTVTPSKPSKPSPPTETERPPKPFPEKKSPEKHTPQEAKTSKPVPEVPKINEGENPILKIVPLPEKSAPSEMAKITTPTPLDSPPSLRTPPSPANPASEREVLASMSKIDGGVSRVGKATAFNSAESPFAAYDKKIIAKIGAYWQYQVVDKFFGGEKTGEVEVSFRLMDDGRITDVKVVKNTTNALLANWCIQAIEKSSPFEPFPESMKVLVGGHREGNVTFNY